MAYAYFQQSAERPDPNQTPDPSRGNMILVKNTVCPYGTNCYRSAKIYENL